MEILGLGVLVSYITLWVEQGGAQEMLITAEILGNTVNGYLPRD